MYLHRVGAESAPACFTWEPRDCSLYALAVGVGLDDVAFTTEGNIGVAQAVYPSFAFAAVALLADEWPDPCFGTGDFALEQAVLGEQDLRVYRPIEPSGDVAIRTRVAGIHDKGSGALLVLDQDAVDTVTGDAVFTSTVGMFIMGEGGFGGDRSSAPSRPPLPTGAPDHVSNATAPPIQTLLYRHAGNDSNPVHLDAEFAAPCRVGRTHPHRPEPARVRVPRAGARGARRRPGAPALGRRPLRPSGLQRRRARHRDSGSTRNRWILSSEPRASAS